MWFYLKLGFQAKYMDFRCPQASEIPKERPEIHKNARNPDFCEIPIFGKPHGKGPGLLIVWKGQFRGQY